MGGESLPYWDYIILGNAMPFPTTPVLDNFDRSDASPMTGWDAPVLGSISANGATCQGDAAGYGIANWATSITGDQEVFGTISTKGGTDDEVAFGLMLKDTASIATTDGYNLVVEVEAATDAWRLQRIDNAVATILASGTQEFSSGDQHGARWQNGTLFVFYNGSILGSGTDSTYTGTGKIGLTIENTTTRVNDFGGGNVVRRLAMLGAG